MRIVRPTPNHAPQVLTYGRSAASRLGCNRSALWPPALSSLTPQCQRFQILSV